MNASPEKGTENDIGVREVGSTNGNRYISLCDKWDYTVAPPPWAEGYKTYVNVKNGQIQVYGSDNGADNDTVILKSADALNCKASELRKYLVDETLDVVKEFKNGSEKDQRR